MQNCSICKKPWTKNPITHEWTCFVHGRPNGSPMELRVWLIHATILKTEGS
jgi:hypothetical protein